MLKKKISIKENPLFTAGFILLLITIGVSIQMFLLKSGGIESGGIMYSHYNNYLIFKDSFIHLFNNKDLYQLYPMEHWDYFKYSPTFALLMAPFAALPDFVGLLFY